MDALLAWLTDSQTLGYVFVVVMAVIGLMDLLEWFFRKFVTWTHRMRLLWRKLRSEPDPRLLSD